MKTCSYELDTQVFTLKDSLKEGAKDLEFKKNNLLSKDQAIIAQLVWQFH